MYMYRTSLYLYVLYNDSDRLAAYLPHDFIQSTSYFYALS